jgi:hypothetical protein
MEVNGLNLMRRKKVFLGKLIFVYFILILPRRVQYTPKMIGLLKDALSSSKIKEPLDRLGLQLDAFALAKSGRMNTADVLSLIDGYNAEVIFAYIFRIILM